MFSDIESYFGTTTLVTVGYVCFTIAMTMYMLYMVLWFFKKPSRHLLTLGFTRYMDYDFAILIFSLLLMYFVLVFVGQVMHPYEVVLAWGMGLPFVLVVLTVLTIKGWCKLMTIRDKIPGAD